MMVTYDTMRVLHAILMARDPICGAEIMKALAPARNPLGGSGSDLPGIGPGTLYPMLARLVAAGWLVKVATLPAPDRPASHFYRLTPEGRVDFLVRLCRITIPDHLWRSQPDEAAT